MFLKILCVLISSIVSALLIIYRKRNIISILGTVIWAYVLGILCSLLFNKILGQTFQSSCVEVLEIVAYLSVAIGIPLILFSNGITNIGSVSRDVKRSFLLLVISVATVTVALYALYTRHIENGKILSAMAMAIYTGGTPNLNAVAYILHLDSSTLLAANLSDIVIGGIFYLFIILFSKSITKNQDEDFSFDEIKTSNTVSSKAGALKNLIISIGLVIVSAGIGALVWFISGKQEGRLTDYLVPFLMIGTSIGGVLLSRIESINQVEENNVLGQFFITLFSFSIASLINTDILKSITGGIFVVFLIITVGSFFLHLLLCKLFKINIKVMIVTSTAGIYGPAFIPGVCTSLKATRLIPAGLIMGSLGYAIGTFLGLVLIILL